MSAHKIWHAASALLHNCTTFSTTSSPPRLAADLQQYNRTREADVRQTVTRPYFAILGALAAFLAAHGAALAHAMLDHASPTVGSAQATAPREVVLWFTDELEPSFSTIEVRDASGSVMSSGKASVDPKQRTQLRVPLKSLEPGTYTVSWRVISVDTHRSQGNFIFRVGQ